MKSSQQTTNEPPAWWADAAKKSLSISDAINKVGYVPYQGNEIAGFTPMQQAGMQSNNDWLAAANGGRSQNAMRGMPQATRDASGVSGFGSYQGLLANLKQMRNTMPAQYRALTQIGGNLLGNPTQTAGGVTGNIWDMSGSIHPGGGGGGGGGGSGDPFTVNKNIGWSDYLANMGK